jgi:hypothetical protein
MEGKLDLLAKVTKMTLVSWLDHFRTHHSLIELAKINHEKEHSTSLNGRYGLANRHEYKM